MAFPSMLHANMSLPTGTVTFLFTDVEGSTRLLNAHPDAYRRAIQRHHDLLAEAIAVNHGVVFETVGDGVYAAFARPSDAVAAALWGQLALQTEDWGETPIRVRMGIDLGEIELHGSVYFVAPLVRCARLMSTAHGGQVVVARRSDTRRHAHQRGSAHPCRAEGPLGHGTWPGGSFLPGGSEGRVRAGPASAWSRERARQVHAGGVPGHCAIDGSAGDGDRSAGARRAGAGTGAGRGPGDVPRAGCRVRARGSGGRHPIARAASGWAAEYAVRDCRGQKPRAALIAGGRSSDAPERMEAPLSELWTGWGTGAECVTR
ncbi:MAG: adenylate/guanylate cyclase domain-containing protein [Chloroflexi bacterium]|nr:adenylate/guanylate cyclase domain-containing protein [Chloroflexota bacterium]